MQSTLTFPVIFALSVPWGRVPWEFLHFVASFGIYGALGFRYIVLRRSTNGCTAAVPEGLLMEIGRTAERNAAGVGVLGAFFLLLNSGGALGRTAQEKQLDWLGAAGQMGPQFFAQAFFAFLLLVAFGLALRRVRLAWGVTAVVALALALRKIVTWQWQPLVNPIHEVSASLWLGTL